MRNQKLLIAIPTYQHCETETFQSIYALKIPNGIDAELHFQKGYTVEQARNFSVVRSLKEGFDYTFFVDSDIILPPDALEKLLSLNAPIATGWYIKKIPGQHIPEIYKQSKNGMTNYTSLPENEIMRIAGCGFGCTLINNDVFEAISDNLWFIYRHEENGAITSEDLEFCEKAGKLDIPIVLDTSLRCGHIGQMIF